jgi:Tfp pilus assembly protein PilX
MIYNYKKATSAKPSQDQNWCADKCEKNGFTVLFAVIVSSLVLALGLGIVAITMKEVRLSGTGRDSQLAFYAADSGLECAEYYDLTQSAFDVGVQLSTIKCNKHDITSTSDSVDGVGRSVFRMYMEYDENSVDLPLENKPCAVVTVTKDSSAVPTTTVIDARGYNTCDTTNTRRLERGYSVRY